MSSSRRGPNYSVGEDVALCQSWVQVSTDSATGIFQSQDTFYKRVKESFDKCVSGSSKVSEDRTSVSLSSRFHTISQDVSKFVACLRKVRGPNGMGPSGTS